MKILKKKRVVASVISDLVSDQRVHKVCTYLHAKGYHVTLIGRAFPESLPVDGRVYATERIACYFRKGIPQYAEFNLKLFIKLLSKKADVFLANDLDTLAPNFLNAFVRQKKLMYDSHEYFTGTPELQQKPLKRKFWKLLEKWLIPRADHAYTVNAAVADRYKKECGVDMKIVRNVPLCNQTFRQQSLPVLPADRFILLWQSGGINHDRGGEELIESIQLLPDFFLLVIIGNGDVLLQLQQKTAALKLADKIRFIPKVPFSELSAYTKQAHLGLSLDKLTCLNYELSLPNKLFDYMHAGVPVLASEVTDVKRIINTYKIGMCIPEITPQAIAKAIEWIYMNKAVYDEWKKNTAVAAKDFCWENEQLVLDEIYND